MEAQYLCSRSKSAEMAFKKLPAFCRPNLEDSDILVVLPDGLQVDDGNAWEMGYFFAKSSPEQKIIGIRTGFRRAGESEGAIVDAMPECSCDWIVRTSGELLEMIFRFF